MLDYKALKSCIFKACKARRKDKFDRLSFDVDYDKLSNSVYDLGLILVKTNLNSRPITEFDVFSVSEFLKDQHLSWITRSKDFTILTFIVAEEEDQELIDLLDKMKTINEDDPDLDKVKVLADIESKYACYHSLIISYESSDPDRIGRITYQITSRANTIAIRKENYKYNNKDMRG